MAGFHKRARTLFLFVLLPFGLCALKVFLVVPLSSLFVVSTPRTPTPRGRTKMHGFKEDFDAWRQSLTEDERQMLKRQVQGEYNKKYRKSEEFKKDLSEDKQKEFSVIIKRWAENEMEEEKKKTNKGVVNYDALLGRSREKGNKEDMFFRLDFECDPLDRDAHRRWLNNFRMSAHYENQGKWFPPVNGAVDRWLLQNNDTESNEMVKFLFNGLRDTIAGGQRTEQSKSFMEGAREFFEKRGVPRVGEPVELHMRQSAMMLIKKLSKLYEENPDLAGVTEDFLELMAESEQSTQEVEEEVQKEKRFFRSQLDRVNDKISQADLILEIYDFLDKQPHGNPYSPLDPDALAPFRDKPAVVPGKKPNPWGYADKLYRSIALDGFGDEYLLGVYENPEEAKAAFDQFKQQYVDEKAKQKDELVQATKRENARYQTELCDGHDNMIKMIETARSKYR